MRFLEGDQVAQVVDGIISSKKQQGRYEMDLTVARVFEVTGGGAVDFGGSEEEAAARNELQPQKESDDDKYGWWHLAEGSYVVEFNERPALLDTQIAFLQPHERLVRAGAAHAGFFLREAPDRLETLITVGTGGIRIKQNARITRCLVLQLDSGR